MHLEEKVCAEAYSLSADDNLSVADIAALREPAALVEFGVVGDIALGNNTLNLAVGDDYCTVIEVVFVIYRRRIKSLYPLSQIGYRRYL